MGGVAQCFLQLPEEPMRVKGNQISPIKCCLCWGTSQRCCSDSGNPFAAPFCPSLVDLSTAQWSLGRSPEVIDTTTPWP